MLILGIVLLALGNAAIKAIGPVLLASEGTSPQLRAAIDALGQCLLAGLVAAALIGPRGTGFDPAILVAVVVAVCLRIAGRHELLCALAALLTCALLRLAA